MTPSGEMVEKFVERMDAMLDHMRADYALWSDLGDDPNGTRARMTEEYSTSLSYLSLIHISSPRDRTRSRMPSSA